MATVLPPGVRPPAPPPAPNAPATDAWASGAVKVVGAVALVFAGIALSSVTSLGAILVTILGVGVGASALSCCSSPAAPAHGGSHVGFFRSLPSVFSSFAPPHTATLGSRGATVMRPSAPPPAPVRHRHAGGVSAGLQPTLSSAHTARHSRPGARLSPRTNYGPPRPLPGPPRPLPGPPRPAPRLSPRGVQGPHAPPRSRNFPPPPSNQWSGGPQALRGRVRQPLPSSSAWSSGPPTFGIGRGSRHQRPAR